MTDFVFRVSHMERQNRNFLRECPRGSWQGDPFLAVKMHEPTWTRARWDQAHAALA